MGRRTPSPAPIKIHRSYAVDDIARALKVHKNTVRAWLGQGLTPIDGRRPTLVHGMEIRRFLQARRQTVKRPCGRGQLFCVRCRRPRDPAGDIAEYNPISATSGNLRGICPVCEALIHRRVSLSKLEAVRGNLQVVFPQGDPRIGKSAAPSLNCDLDKEAVTHADP